MTMEDEAQLREYRKPEPSNKDIMNELKEIKKLLLDKYK